MVRASTARPTRRVLHSLKGVDYVITLYADGIEIHPKGKHTADQIVWFDPGRLFTEERKRRMTALRRS